MNIESNPYHPPDDRGMQNSRADHDIQRLPRIVSAVIGTCIGFCVGIFWTIVFGPVTDGPPSIELSFLVYTTGFTFTGFVVGVLRRFPPLTGMVVGTLSLSVWAFAVGPKDAWGILWLFLFGGSGLFWGLVIGIVYWVVDEIWHRRSST